MSERMAVAIGNDLSAVTVPSGTLSFFLPLLLFFFAVVFFPQNPPVRKKAIKKHVDRLVRVRGGAHAIRLKQSITRDSLQKFWGNLRSL
jgi:hypothetical protein